MPAGAIALRPDRVVEIAGVGAVDRDQRQRAQVLPAVWCYRQRGQGLAFGGRRERDRQIEAVRGHHRDRARVARIAQPLGDAAVAGTQRLAGEALGDHQLAGIRAQAVGGADAQLASPPAAGRAHPQAVARALEDTHELRRLGRQDPHHAGFLAAVGRVADARQDPIADAGCAAALGRDRDVRRILVLRRTDRAREAARRRR